MYLYYHYKSTQKSDRIVKPPIGYQIQVGHINTDYTRTEEMGVGPVMFLYLSIMTFLCRGLKRILREYRIVKNNTIVCKLVVNSWCPIYRFMPKHALHVGFARTIPEERGNGLYPLLLEYVKSDLDGFDLYMIVDETNSSSIRGIEKAGFDMIASGEKEGRIFKIIR